MNEVINGYELIEPFQNQNAGFSRWTFARRNGRTYFLKEFMDPVYPDEESLSSMLRQRRIADCQNFERKKRRLYDAIDRASDGNTIRICELFRCDSHYYISNIQVVSEKVTFAEIAAMPLADRILLCRTVAHSLMKLHEKGVVHSDIKHTNVLLQRSVTGKLVAKLIDFDSSFFEDDPPETEDELGGDQVYLAPEACMFICGDPAELTCKIDVFSLGLLFHEYLTGELPGFDREEYDYAHEAALDDQELEVSESLPCPLQNLIREMLVCDPQERISMAEVFHALGEFMEEKPTVPEKSPIPKPDPGKKVNDYFFTAGDL